MKPGSETEYRFRGLRVLTGTAQVLRGTDVLPLTPKAVAMLIVLIERRDRAVSKEELFELVWPDVTVEESNLSFTANLIRKTLGADVLRTLPKIGYQFVAQLEHVPTAPPVSENNLGLGRGLMIGRDQDLANLTGLLAPGRLVTVIGPPGVGKTTLAVEVGRALLPSLPGGAWQMDVSGFTEPTAMLDAIASLVGVRLAPGRDTLQALALGLAGRPLLLILHGAEGVRATVARATTGLLARCQDLRILVTSRVPLAAEGERVYRLTSLATAGPAATAEQAGRIPAVALFTEVARGATGRDLLIDATAPVIARICRTLDGLPLAIRMVAVRAGAVDLEFLAGRVADYVLAAGSPVRSAFDLSWSLLDDDGRNALIAVSAFTGSFDMIGAYVVGGGTQSEAAFIDCFGELVNQSLIEAEGDLKRRYRLLDTIRAYLGMRCDAAADRLRHRAVAAHLVERMSLIDTAWHRTAEADCVAVATAELESLRGALTWAFSEDGDPVLAIRLAGSSAQIWHNLSLYAEGRHWLGRAIQLIEREGEPPSSVIAGSHARVWCGMVRLLGETDPKASRIAAERALVLAERAGDDISSARSRSGIGMSMALGGEHESAERMIREAIATLEQMNAPKPLGHAWANLAFVLTSTDRRDQAIDALNQAVRLLRGLQDEATLTRFEHALALLYFLTGDAMGAIERIERVVEKYRCKGNPDLRLSLLNLASFKMLSAAPRTAMVICEEAWAGSDRLDDLSAVGLVELIALIGAPIQPRVSARLLGWADAQPIRRDRPRQELSRAIYDRAQELVRARLGAAVTQDLMREGARWDEVELREESTALLAAARAAPETEILAFPSAG